MRKGIIGLLALAVIIVVGLYVGTDLKKSSAVDANGIQPAASGETSVQVEETKPAATEYKTYAMGNPEAPVKIKEYASLSCPHCAEFHTGTLPQVKKELIDTGKVYFEFVNFPLNASAMDGALIALCMPEERYNQFISFLFEQQQTWAFDQNYRNILKQNAKLLGASEEKLDACLADEKKKADIVAGMQAAQEKHNIQSTPSFVINDKETISGDMNFEAFKKKIEEHLPQEKVAQ